MQAVDRPPETGWGFEMPRIVVRDEVVPSGWILLVAVGAALAIWLRLWAIDAIGLNSDEAVYVGQAGVLAGDDGLAQFFTPFRAHPLLVQSSLALLFSVVGVSDVAARVFVAVVFGLGSLVATASLTRRMYGATTAAVATCILAVLPYHVVLSRQVMLDVPAVFFLLLAARAVYLSVVRARRWDRWWYASAVWVGLAVATKETSILFVAVIGLFVGWSGALRGLGRRKVLGWAGVFSVVVASFFLTRVLFGHNGGGYVVYQFLRPPNHPWWYLPVVLWEFVTPPVIAFALIGLATMARRRSVADKLVLSWALVFSAFFQAWPTKLFPYAMAVTPALVVAAATGIRSTASAIGASFGRARTHAGAIATSVLAGVLVATLLPPAVLAAGNSIDREEGPLETDVEVQDFVGGREMGRWAAESSPPGAVYLTIGPSVGNILSFYGHREWYALSVSREPSLRNPAYRPLVNPDLAIRQLRVHYAVWDAYSADRSGFYSGMLLRLVRNHGGWPVFSAWIDDRGQMQTGVAPPEGADVRIVVYDLPGGDPTTDAPLPVVDR